MSDLPDTAIVVIASFRLPVAALPRARALLPDVLAATRAEAGCERYDIGDDVEYPGLFRVSEVWHSRAHLDAHLAAPHMAEWGKARAEMGMTERQVAIFSVSGVETL